MRILLLQDRAYFSWAVGVKVNRFLAHSLAARGHEVRAVATLEGSKKWSIDPSGDDHCRVLHHFEDRLDLEDKQTIVTLSHRIEKFKAIAKGIIQEFRPDVILFSEASDYANLNIVPENDLGRCIIMVHCTETLPFGPYSHFPDRTASRRFRESGGLITVCKFLQEYMRKHVEKDSIVLSFPGYGTGPFPDYSNFDNGFVLLVNASQIKGLHIFLELARVFPQTEFGAISTWATTETDMSAIKEIPNVRLIEANPNIDKILRHTRILLVPSLWQEAFPITVIEAELRGIPTLVSQVGGLPETKFGTDYILPVNPIQDWKYGLDCEEIVIEPKIPQQETGPWIQSVKTLLENRMKYESISRECRKAAHDFLKRISIGAFEEYFEDVVKNARKSSRPTSRKLV